MSSTQYIQVGVTATIAGVAYNPTHDPVFMAFVTTTDPKPSDFYPATWQSYTNSSGNPVYRAVCLVGPGSSVILPIGTYTVWVKIEDNPEVPVLRSGTLTIT